MFERLRKERVGYLSITPISVGFSDGLQVDGARTGEDSPCIV